jgi:hypothetical protein
MVTKVLRINHGQLDARLRSTLAHHCSTIGHADLPELSENVGK